MCICMCSCTCIYIYIYEYEYENEWQTNDFKKLKCSLKVCVSFTKMCRELLNMQFVLYLASYSLAVQRATSHEYLASYYLSICICLFVYIHK